MEIMSMINSLDEFAKTKNGEEMFSSIGPGIFAKTSLAENDNLLVNVGAGVIVKKSVSETKELIQKQFVEVQKLQRDITTEIQNLVQKAQKLEQSISR